MTPAQLDLAVAATRHERLRVLTDDANPDAEQREAYRELVRRIADGGALPAPPAAVAAPGLAASLADIARARACRHKVAPSCGCRYGDCARLGREVGPADCLACLKAGDDAGAAPPA